MLISEKERLMLVEKKEKINQITGDIIKNFNASPDKTFIINKMNEVVSLISTISSYSDSKSHNSQVLYNFTEYLVGTLEVLKNEELSSRKVMLMFWCTTVNSIEFNFTEKKPLIRIPPIDFNLFKQSISGFKTGLEFNRS